MTIETNSSSLIRYLRAAGPDPVLKEKLMLFGQFVGDWDIVEDRYLESHGKWVQQRGAVRFDWILAGRAVQDVWSYIDEEDERTVPEGTSVRFYDPKMDAWRSVWMSPNQGAVVAFVGRKSATRSSLRA